MNARLFLEKYLDSSIDFDELIRLNSTMDLRKVIEVMILYRAYIEPQAIENLEDIKSLVFEVFNARGNDYKSRKREEVESRYMIMTILRKCMNLSERKAGLPFMKDHATVNHACKKVSNFYCTDKIFRQKVNFICDKLNIKVEKIL